MCHDKETVQSYIKHVIPMHMRQNRDTYQAKKTKAGTKTERILSLSVLLLYKNIGLGGISRFEQVTSTVTKY